MEILLNIWWKYIEIVDIAPRQNHQNGVTSIFPKMIKLLKKKILRIE